MMKAFLNRSCREVLVEHRPGFQTGKCASNLGLVVHPHTPPTKAQKAESLNVASECLCFEVVPYI